MSVTSIRLREAWNWGGLTVKQLAVRTYQQIETHEALDRAAALAFYAMLSLVPFLSLLLAGGIGTQSGNSSQLLALSRNSCRSKRRQSSRIKCGRCRQPTPPDCSRFRGRSCSGRPPASLWD